MIDINVIMRIPLDGDRATARVKLHKPHATLHQPPRQEAASAELGGARIIEPVECPGRRRFTREIHGLGRSALHAVGKLVTCDPRRKLGVGRIEILLVHGPQQVKRVALPVE